MAYKTFIAGDEALAADVNTLLMGQTVARFSTAAARTAAGTGITAPVLNQLSALDTAPGVLDYWNGSAWVPVSAGFIVDRAIATPGSAFTPGVQFVPGADFTLPAARNYRVVVQLVVTLNVAGFADVGVTVNAVNSPTYPAWFPAASSFMRISGEWIQEGPFTPGKVSITPSQAGTINRGEVLVFDAGPKVTIT